MNKKFLSLAVAAMAFTSVFAQNAPADTVLFNVDGNDVMLSEFEYLYNKNNSQQTEPQTRGQYYDMFLLYKLKVADAVANGMDTTETFRKEFNQYRRDLAVPYLLDKEAEQQMIDLSYEMLKEYVDVSHIMLPHSNDPGADTANRLRLDSIRNEVLAGRADFDEMARQFSVDQMVKRTGNAHMGLVRGTATYPYPFVEASYTTKVGDISPVIDSGFGYHIVRPEKRVANDGEVKASHILKLTRGLDEAQKAQKKAEIDSIYKVLLKGESFADVARVESEDPGSAANGGDLGYFGRGMMVPEFENVAFEIADGAISEPFESPFGYHIILREAHRGVPSFEEALPRLKNEINNDERGDRPRKAMLAKLRKKYNAQLSDKGFDEVAALITANGGYDSVVIVKLLQMDTPLATTDFGAVTVADAVSNVGKIARVSAEAIMPYIKSTTERALETALFNYAVDKLPSQNEEYRNLVNEYHDGILLFEISNRNVWERSSKDKEGLEKFFRAHKKDYQWNVPKYKGYIIFTTSDSLLTAVQSYLGENKIAPAELVTTLRKQFGKDVKAEKVLAAKGENNIVDAAVFDGEKPGKLGRWGFFFPYDGKILEQPEEAADVRGAVTADYQTLLEKQWVKSLKSKHKVKPNKEVVNSLK
ncbi:MAG: peptidylprolyl isomerase [Muribaculaceae bacterium]|nr:peptidylprolyl isomerase [Muribaculaceae bacterium]